MTVSRPGNKTPGVKFSVESDFQVKNKQFLRPEGKNKEKRNSKNSKKSFLSVIFFFLLFLFNPFTGLISKHILEDVREFLGWPDTVVCIFNLTQRTD